MNAMETVKKENLVQAGETVVITAGDPATNEGNWKAGLPICSMYLK